jgi:FMN reductase
MSGLVAVHAGDSTASRTRQLASAALEAAGGGLLIELAHLPADALLGRTRTGDVDQAVRAAADAEVLLLATPVYRATYSGVMKAFLDRFPQAALEGTAVVLAATAAVPDHFLSLDTAGRALVASLEGWTVPTVVYAVPSDFGPDGVSPHIRARLRRALAEAGRLRRLPVQPQPAGRCRTVEA